MLTVLSLTALVSCNDEKSDTSEPSAETAAGRVDAVVGVIKKIPFPGKRGEAGLAAQREALAVRADEAAYELKLTESQR